jgi:hypothetical protein
LAAIWTAHSCEGWGTCDDIGGGWFAWAFRDAVAGAGHYRSGREARRFYVQLASEIDAACGAGTIACRAKGRTLFPPITPANVPAIVKNFWLGLGLVATYAQLGYEPWHVPANESLRPDYDFIARSVSDGVGVRRLDGFLAHEPLAAIAVVGPDGKEDAQASFHFSASPSDFATPAPLRNEPAMDVHFARFDVDTSCLESCRIAITATDGRRFEIPISSEPTTFRAPGIAFQVLSAQDLNIEPLDAPVKAEIVSEIGQAYQIALRYLLVVSLLLVAARLVRIAYTRVWEFSDHIVLALATLVGATLLMGILATIYTLSFPGFTTEYMGALFPLMLLMVAFVIAIEGAAFVPWLISILPAATNEA